MKLIKQIPNLLTLSNLFIGCVAIVKIFGNDTQTGCLLLFVAALIDFLDGFAARLLNAKSDMGGQLDSLADVVTFGVAPGIIFYQLLANAWRMETNAMDTPELYFLPAFIISCAAAYRLAKYNLTANEQTTHFIGLPTPAMALFVASLPIILFTGNTAVGHFILNKYLLYAIILMLSYLMICQLPLINLKPANLAMKGNESRLILVAISLGLIIWLKFLAVPLIIAAYLALSIFQFSVLEKKKLNE